MLSFNVDARQDTLRLSGAILTYGADPNASSIATVHTVREVEGRATLMPGRLITESDLVNLAEGVAGSTRALTTEWLEARMLARGTDRMIWWSGPGKRAMFFEKSSYNSTTWEGQGVCPLPGLVWMAKQNEGLFVFAFRGDGRPGQDTELYQAPLYNVWGRGKVCVGSAKLPTGSLFGDLDAWEKVIFGSRFTHPNFSEPNRLVHGVNPVKFWKSMVTSPPAEFPAKRLVKVPLKVGDLLERDVVDRLNAWPKPSGEF